MRPSRQEKKRPYLPPGAKRSPKVRRLPRAKISEIGDIVYKDDEAVGYEITLQAMPDDTGATHYEYFKGEEEESIGG